MSAPAIPAAGIPSETAALAADDGHRPARAAGSGTEAVTVRPGDSLWAIAQRALPPPATDDDIDTAWHAWYVANIAVVGDDPDMIQPGQVLLPPHSKVG
jgi:nucleoid-associated protein YgaU